MDDAKIAGADPTHIDRPLLAREFEQELRSCQIHGPQTSIRGRDFLVVAQMLSRFPSHGEAMDRTIIGRAYYSAFLEAKEYLRLNGHLSTCNTHSFVEQAMRRYDRSVARNLRQLRSMRNDADYEIVYPRPNLRNQAELALHLAQQIITAIELLP